MATNVPDTGELGNRCVPSRGFAQINHPPKAVEALIDQAIDLEASFLLTGIVCS